MSCPPAVSGALTSSGAPGTPRCCRLQASTDTSTSTPSWEAATRRRAWDTPTRWAQTSWERRKETLIQHLLCLTWLSLQISTSFGNMDPFGTGQTLPPLQLPQTTAPPASVTPLKKPPKWIRRPVGASFAVSPIRLVFMTLRIEHLCFTIWNLLLAFVQFGGKLVSLENTKPNPQQPTAHVVHISQVVTETAFLQRSEQLQATLSAGGFVDFCQEKIDAAANEFEKTLWCFLKVVKNHFVETFE